MLQLLWSSLFIVCTLNGLHFFGGSTGFLC